MSTGGKIKLIRLGTVAALTVLGFVFAIFLLRSKPSIDPNAQADRIVVEKQAHILKLYRGGQLLKTYHVALGRGGLGPKLHAGDNKVPEGVYRISGRNPHSTFHLALRVGYPTPEQISQARAQGIDPGGDIMIHGIRQGLGWLGPLHRYLDWTRGCVAVTNDEIEEIWTLVPDGMPIEIRP